VPKWIRLALLVAVAILAAEWWSSQAPATLPASPGSAATESAGAPSAAPAESARFPAFLPPEAVATLEAIERGGPFTYDRDGTVFQNRERLLPDQPRGYYREYTVQTPGSRDRGARRIVAGGQPPEVYYYTDDHYRSFRRVESTR
jgi:guanyl-specific ribonuclease Sa